MKLTIKAMNMFAEELLAMLTILHMLFISVTQVEGCSHQLTNLMSLDCPLLTEPMANATTFGPLLAGHMESREVVITVLVVMVVIDPHVMLTTTTIVRPVP